MALELVGFDDEVRAAIEHVFGNALVTDSLQLAKVHPDTYPTSPPVPVLRFVDIC
jgi:chromosome segregation ATPase